MAPKSAPPAASPFKPEDLIGKSVRLTLANDDVREGVVFTYVPESELIVIMSNLAKDKPTVQMVRLPFVKDVSVAERVEKLPPSLSKDDLPTLLTSNQTLQKVSVKHINEAVRDRSKQLEIMREAPMRAVDAYLRLKGYAHCMSWDAHNGAIKVGDNVVIESTDGWKTFEVGAVKNTEDTSMVERIRKTLGLAPV